MNKDMMELHDLYGKHEVMNDRIVNNFQAREGIDLVYGYGWGACACGRTLAWCQNTGKWRPMSKKLCIAMMKHRPELKELLDGCNDGPLP